MDLAINPTRGSDVAFFLQNLAGGGAERSIVALAGEIAKRGYTVDLLLGDVDSDYRSEISPDVKVQSFATRSSWLVFRRLMAYLRRRNPTVVMSALDAPNIILVAAARFGGYDGRTVISQRAVVDASHSEWSLGRRVTIKLLQRVLFPRADVVISNSQAAAKDLLAQFRIAAEKVVTIHNALDADRIGRLAAEPLVDPFLQRDRTPLIISVGSLTKRKDMTTLVRAFAAVKRQRPARLVIIGKGDEEQNIRALIADLGLTADVHLPGFDPNPYKWMSAAAVFVSSSVAEGFPNVIAEALALHRSIVATDCPGDTAELLAHGRWGRLVPVGDFRRMADAIVEALDDSHPPDGRIRAADFTPSKITAAYLDVLLPKADRSANTFRRSV